MIQEYADEGRGCGHAIVFGDQVAGLVDGAQDEISDGWIPVEIHDLDTGDWWGIDTVPVFCGPTRPPTAVAIARADLAELAVDCGYSPHEECSVDALIAYKDAIEDRLAAAIATGWTA